MPGPPALPEDRDPPPRRQRLVREHLRGVEQLFQRVDADHSRLTEERVDGDVGGRERGRVRRRGAATGLCTPALHGDDRLLARDASRKPRELAGIPERFQVEEDHRGVGVGLPVLEQVVAAQVGLVPDRDELRDADTELAGAAHELDAEPARLRAEPNRAAHGFHRRERCVHAHTGGGVHDTEAVRPDDSHAVAPGGGHDCALGRLAVAADLGEPGRDDHEPVYTLLCTLLDDGGNGRGGYDDHREVDRVGNVQHGCVRPHARDRRRGRVHGIHRPLELVTEQVAEQLVADRALFSARANDRDRRGGKQPRG